MGALRMRIGGDGPVVAETDAQGWRLIVRGQMYATGAYGPELHSALRELALRDRALAPDAFGVICNCIGAWEDEFTEEYGEDALSFEDWMERLEADDSTSLSDGGDVSDGGHTPAPTRTAPRVGGLYRTNTLIPQEYDNSIGPDVLVEVLANRSYGGSDVRVVETGQEFFCPWGNLVPEDGT